MSSKKGILYERLPSVDGRRGWYEGREGDEEKDKEGYPKYNKYEGEIENGKPNGNGTCKLINGATYVGQYVDGLREGLGTFTWSIHAPDGGGVYEGGYKNNRRNGKGKRTYRDGSILEGYWKDNKLWNRKKHDKEVNISGKCVNGGWIKL